MVVHSHDTLFADGAVVWARRSDDVALEAEAPVNEAGLLRIEHVADFCLD